MYILGIKVRVNINVKKIYLQTHAINFLFLDQENVDKQKQSDGADEVYVMLIQQLLKPDNEGVLMTGKILLSF